MNHDTQPHQDLAAPVTDWFKPLAYALVLLRDRGYPCVWYGDLYGTRCDRDPAPPLGGDAAALARLVLARKLYCYGAQADYFDYPTCVGWVRYGTWDRPAGCAVVVSNAGPGRKRMHVGEMHAGEAWTDVLGLDRGKGGQPPVVVVVIGEDGFGEFRCGEKSVGVWVNREAEGRGRFEERL